MVATHQWAPLQFLQPLLSPNQLQSVLIDLIGHIRLIMNNLPLMQNNDHLIEKVIRTRRSLAQGQIVVFRGSQGQIRRERETLTDLLQLARGERVERFETQGSGFSAGRSRSTGTFTRRIRGLAAVAVPLARIVVRETGEAVREWSGGGRGLFRLRGNLRGDQGLGEVVLVLVLDELGKKLCLF